MYTIYKHTNTITGKSYIGYTSKSMEERWMEHVYCSRSYTTKPYKFWRALRKYGTECWTHEIIETTDHEQSAKAMEIQFIAECDSFRCGYNTTKGGQGAMVGRRHTVQAIQKMRQAALLRSEVVGPKISKAKQNLSLTAREHIHNGQLGKTMSEAAKQNMSMSSRKQFIVEHLDGRRSIICGLKNWCGEMNLNEKTLRVTLKNKSFVKRGLSQGWKAIYVN